MKSLRTRLMVYFTITLIIVGFGLGFIAYNTASYALEQNSRESLLELSTQAASIVSKDYQANILKIEMIADRSEIKSMDWETQLPVMLEEIERNDFLTMGVIYEDGYGQFVGEDEPTFLGDREHVINAFYGVANISDVIISRVTNSTV